MRRDLDRFELSNDIQNTSTVFYSIYSMTLLQRISKLAHYRYDTKCEIISIIGVVFLAMILMSNLTDLRFSAIVGIQLKVIYRHNLCVSANGS